MSLTTGRQGGGFGLPDGISPLLGQSQYVEKARVSVSQTIPLAPIQAQFKQFEKDKHFQLKKFEGSTPSATTLVMADVGSLFDAIYRTGIITPKDAQEIQEFKAKVETLSGRVNAVNKASSLIWALAKKRPKGQ